MNIEKIVKNELCTGCGACISEDTSSTAEMAWNDQGFLVPKLTEKSNQNSMIQVCPFNPKQLNEDELSEVFIKNTETRFHSKIGNFYNLYVGYSEEFRDTSSSGGLATFFFENLLKNNIVQHLFVVVECEDSYAYKLISNITDIKKTSKTRYIPVTLEDLFKKIISVEGKVAVSGIACFVKAIRLKQNKNIELKEKIPFVVGIICGGLKSKYYTDFLAQSAGCMTNYENAQYRVKEKVKTATDYKFSCDSKLDKRIHMVEMRQLGDMWGSGLFKSNACDFCDDVLTELADVSLGDAWLPPYSNDGAGNSIIITRSKVADEIVKSGIDSQNLRLDDLSLENLLISQRGSFNHRHKGLKFRMDYVKSKGGLVPEKRKRFMTKQNFLFNLVQVARMNTRKDSLSIWSRHPEVDFFNSKMQKSRHRLKILNLWSNRVQKLNTKDLKRIMLKRFL